MHNQKGAPAQSALQGHRRHPCCLYPVFLQLQVRLNRSKLGDIFLFPLCQCQNAVRKPAFQIIITFFPPKRNLISLLNAALSSKNPRGIFQNAAGNLMLT